MRLLVNRELEAEKWKRNSWIRENMIPVNFQIQNGVLEYGFL